MKKLSEINESMWGGVMDRSAGREERNENKIITNIENIKPVDIGTSVLWADRELEINDDPNILIDKVKGFEKDGWRLPTRDEADELFKNAHWSTDKNTNKSLGRYYEISISHFEDMPEENTITFKCAWGKEVECWEDKIYEHTPKGYWCTFNFHADGTFFPHSSYGIEKLDKPAKVRLVRDK